MVNLPAVSLFTFYLFWVKAPLSQYRPALLSSKMEVQILIKMNDLTKKLFLVYNLLTTELQNVFYLPLLYCKDWSQLHYLVDMNLFIAGGLLLGRMRKLLSHADYHFKKE